MIRVVVSDTSPIRALAHLNRLDWLAQLFGQIHLPPAVAAELEFPPNPLHAVAPRLVPFFVVSQPTNAVRIAELCQTLDLGEAEALALAEEIQAGLMLIDETTGRRAATAAGFAVLGTLGIILEAKSRGWCTTIEPLLNRLEDELRFFIAPPLKHAVLVHAGEVSSSP